MSSNLKNPLYRYYNCNIQCPKFIASEIQGDKVSFNSYDNGIVLETGEFTTSGTSFTITPACLAQANCCGELTVYFKNATLFYSHISMILVTKTNGVIADTNVVLYQNLGNITSVTAVKSGNTGVTITLTSGQSCFAKWIFRGY